MPTIPNNEQMPGQIPPPLAHDPEALVMNVYPVPGTENVLDLPSQDEMGLHLLRRFEPDTGPRTQVVLEATGRTLPGIQRVPVGYKEVTRLRKTEPREWFVSPAKAAAIMLGSAIVFNAIGNHDTIAGGAERLGHDVYRLFSPVHDTKQVITNTTQEPGKIVDLQVGANVASTDVTGAKISLNSQEIQSLGQKIQVLKSQGGKLLSMEVTGDTSNDWSTKGDAAFGHPNAENAQLGPQVALGAYNEVKSDLAAAGLADVPTTFGQHETVLSQAVTSSLIAEAKAAGYDSLESAVKAVDHGELREGKLFQDIGSNIISKRGETIDVKVELPGKSTTHVTHETKTIPGVDHVPDVPNPKWYWFIPMLPIRRRERYNTMKEVKQFQFTASKEIMRPRIISEDEDHAWAQVRPEAVKQDGTLVANPWAFTPKYEHLLRDGRIAEVLRADFMSPKDEEKSLRIMFIDEKPADETVEVFSNILTKFASMVDGKLADRVSAIFVYPTENAGTEHDNPKRIALGNTKQSSENIVGTYTYILDMIELHMPTTWSPEALEQALATFNGPGWVLGHEGMHAADDNDAPLRLRRVVSRTIPNAHTVDGDPLAGKMRPLQSVLRKLPGRARGKQQPIEFDIMYPVTDNDGETVLVPKRVKEGDDRLAHATHSTIVDHQPTKYAAENVAEHYAETGAAMFGIEVPYTEAAVSVPTLTTQSGKEANFAKGYRPDARAQQLVAQSVGAEEGVYPFSFKNPPAVTISRLDPADDSLLRQEMIRARTVRTLTPSQLVSILARVARRKRTEA
jgi:hypothetical protein